MKDVQQSHKQIEASPGPRFSLGTIVVTPGAQHAFAKAAENPATYLRRHLAGDWGELSAEDRRTNERAMQDGSRILSAYRLSDRTKFWIVTEADRSSTCLLLPAEY